MVGTHDVVLDTSNIFVNRFNVVYIYGLIMMLVTLKHLCCLE